MSGGDESLEFACECGAIRGHAEKPETLRGRRFVCMCDDCQTYAHFLGNTERILDANGGTEVLPIEPARLSFSQGFDRLRGVRLSEQGLFRWYSECCRSPIANSMDGKFGYIGFVSARLKVENRDRTFGPVTARVLSKYGKPPFPPKSYPGIPFSMIWATISGITYMLWHRLRKPSPFFDPESGRPIVTPDVLAPTERERLRALTYSNH